MHYLILTIGILIGLFALYRFFIQANVKQIKAAFLTAALIAVFVALLYLSITGRLPAALALFVAIFPIGLELRKIYKGESSKNKETSEKQEETPQINTTEEALKILGLQPGATKDEIKAAYKKLMQKVHPDNEGSDWMAAKLNQARDILLDKNHSA